MYIIKRYIFCLDIDLSMELSDEEDAPATQTVAEGDRLYCVLQSSALI